MVGNLWLLAYTAASDGPIACLIARINKVPDASLLPPIEAIG